MMLNTVNTKAAHYTDGCFRIGTGDHVIIVLGSCRIFHFANYFQRLNTDNKYTLCVINIVNFMFDEADRPIDSNESTARLESNPVLLDMIRRCQWFIHEYAENFTVLNTSRDAERNIYQLGMTAPVDVTIPNWNDNMILENDYRDYGAPTPVNYADLGEAAVRKFCDLCRLTSFPEMAEYFRDEWRKRRFFWRPNHTSAEFTLFIFRLMNEKFLHLPLTDEFWQEAGKEDLFKEPHTQITDRDRELYHITWH